MLLLLYKQKLRDLMRIWLSYMLSSSKKFAKYATSHLKNRKRSIILLNVFTSHVYLPYSEIWHTIDLPRLQPFLLPWKN
jgi:hypothetical protein